MRLWDDVITWKDIEPSNNNWSFDRFDTIVNFLLDYDQNSKPQILYTLGITPEWARLEPTIRGSEPRNIEDWRDYVRTVGNRYRGKILYYEIWNEFNVDKFSTISPQKMVELTRVAREELLAIDPTIKILSPNITTLGLDELDDFLFYEGSQYIDFLSYHMYADALYPEDSLGFHYAMHNLKKNYDLSHLPIWDTEGNLFFENGYGTTDQEIAAVSRHYLVHWMNGIDNFTWYTWDIHTWGGNFQVRLSTNDYLDTRPAGIAYREISAWLVGSTMISKQYENGIYHVTLINQQGKTNYIVWSYNTEQTFNIPASWEVTQIKTLEATTQNIENQTITIDKKPILLY